MCHPERLSYCQSDIPGHHRPPEYEITILSPTGKETLLLCPECRDLIMLAARDHPDTEVSATLLSSLTSPQPSLGSSGS